MRRRGGIGFRSKHTTANFSSTSLGPKARGAKFCCRSVSFKDKNYRKAAPADAAFQQTAPISDLLADGRFARLRPTAHRQAMLMDKGDMRRNARENLGRPGVFAPVETQGGCWWTEGSREWPIDVARKIARRYSHRCRRELSLQARSALNSGVSISNQMLAIWGQGRGSSKSHLESSDILVSRGEAPASYTDFTADELDHAAGEKAARVMIARLTPGASATAAYQTMWREALARKPRAARHQVRPRRDESKAYEKTIMAEMQPLVGKPRISTRSAPSHGTVRPGAFRDASLWPGEKKTGPGCRSRIVSRCGRDRKSWGPKISALRFESGDNFQATAVQTRPAPSPYGTRRLGA